MKRKIGIIVIGVFIWIFIAWVAINILENSSTSFEKVIMILPLGGMVILGVLVTQQLRKLWQTLFTLTEKEKK